MPTTGIRQLRDWSTDKGKLCQGMVAEWPNRPRYRSILNHKPFKVRQVTDSAPGCRLVESTPTVESSTPIYRGGSTQHNTPTVTSHNQATTCRPQAQRGFDVGSPRLQSDRTHSKARGWKPQPGYGVVTARPPALEFLNPESPLTLTRSISYTLPAVCRVVPSPIRRVHA